MTNYSSNQSGQYSGGSTPPSGGTMPYTSGGMYGGTPGNPSVNKYLGGDSAYQSQLAQLTKQLEQFKAGNLEQRDYVKQDFNKAKNRMGMQRTEDQGRLQSDYASRGLVNSGLYTGAVGDYDTKYQQQLGDLSTDKQRSLADLIGSLQQYVTSNQSAEQNAKQEAIRRRAAQYGIS